MKKNLFYLFALICSMSLFTACSDDDDDANFPTDEVNTTFTSTDASNQLLLTYSGEPMLGKSVTFNTTDGKTATIVLKGAGLSLTKSENTPILANPSVIPGETTTTLNVTLVPVGVTGYTFEGKDESNGRTIDYKGAVEKGKLSLALNVKIANALVGTWNLYPYDPYNDKNIFPLRTVWETTQPFRVDLWGSGDITEMPLGGLLTLVTALGLVNGGEMTLNDAISALLKDVTFRADGNIEASYSEASDLSSPIWVKSPLNMAQYYVKNNKLFLLLNIDAILATIQGNSASTRMDISSILPGLMSLLPMISNGIPLEYSVGENGELGVYIEKELGMQLVNIILPLLQDEEIIATIMETVTSNPSFAFFAGMTKALLEQFPAVVATTTKIELGLNFVVAE